MKAAELRQSILQAAVQGKLVPQNVHDEPAFELLKRIQQEKAQLVKEGKIKKEKPLPPIAEDEVPYDLPDGWAWSRLGDLVSLYDGSIRRGPFGSAIRKDMFVPKSESTYKIYEQGNAIRKTVDYGNYYISDEHYSKLKSFAVIPGDIIISCAGTLGETYILPENAPKGIINQALLKLNINHSIMSDMFFLIVFKAITQQQIVLSSLGSAMKNLVSISWLKEQVAFPLPPLAEQQRIVAKVDELMALCDELEVAEKELDALEKRFEDYLPKTILQAAVQGKLVSQNVYDEPASELLKRIQLERTRLVKEGKIKKEKPLPPIAEDEIPYDLPDGWVWCHIGDISTVRGGKRIPKGMFFSKKPTEHIYIRVTDMKNNTISDQTLKYIDNEVYKNISQYTISADDVYVTIAGTIGKCGIVPDKFDGMNLTENAAKLCYIGIDKRFLMTAISSGTVQEQFKEKTNQMAQPKLALERIASTYIPLPPLAEQQRIVAKVDELMALCDELKAAKVFAVKSASSNVVPFPQQGEDEDLLMVAQGEVSGKLSKELRQAQEDLFGDGADE